MKESIIDVLMYLFEHYIEDDFTVEPNRDDLEDQLVKAGFGGTEVSKAFDWLEDLAQLESTGAAVSDVGSLRIYTEDEKARLGVEGIGFIHFLEQNKVLLTSTREQVIERTMALESPHIDLDQLKWVALMVMFNQPGEDNEYLAWLEDLVYNQQPTHLH